MSPADEPLADVPEDPATIEPPIPTPEAGPEVASSQVEDPAIFAANEPADGARTDSNVAENEPAPARTKKKRKTKASGVSRRKKKSARSRAAKTLSHDDERAEASEEQDRRGDNGAFPFLGDGADVESNEVDIAGHDETIAGLADAEWMRKIEHDGAAAVAQAAAEVAAAARLDAAASAATESSANAAFSSDPNAAEQPSSLRARVATWLGRTRVLLGAGGARAALRRVVVAAGLAMAAGIGYGAAVRLFFDETDSGLSANSANDLITTTPAASDETTEVADSSHPGAGDARPNGEGSSTDRGESSRSPDLAALVNPASDPTPHNDDADDTDPSAPPLSAEPADAESGDIVTAGSPGETSADAATEAAVKVETRIVGPEKPFSMPEISTSLPRKNHPLANGRERLDRGDLEAARRTATDFLLREDGLSAEDRLFVAQAYALLADSLKVELDRNRADVKQSSAPEDRSASRPLPAGAEVGP